MAVLGRCRDEVMAVHLKKSYCLPVYCTVVKYGK